MPFIRITVAGEISAIQRRQLQSAFTHDVHLLLGKRREVTAVAVLELSGDGWAIDGTGIDGRAAHVEIAITSGTNTIAEKSAMVATADARLREILGPLPEATYVVIHEIGADLWGYGGRTQRDRHSAHAEPGAPVP